MKKVMVLVLLTFCFFIFFEKNTKAEKKFEVDVKTTESTIELKWTDIADHYALVKNETTIDSNMWSGEEPEFIVRNLDKNTLYKYTIIAYDSSGNIINLAKINTSTKNTTENGTISESSIQSIIYKNRVELTWEDIPDDNMTYEIYRDEKLLSQNAKNKFIDKNIQYGERYIYRVRGKKKNDEKTIEEIKKKLEENEIEFTEEIEKEIEYQSFDLAHNVGTLNADNEKNIKSFNTQAKKFEEPTIYSLPSNNERSITKSSMNTYAIRPGYALITHTWIPVKKVNFVVPPYIAFKGDTRKDPNMFDNRYRTKHVATAIFNGGSNVSFSTPVRKVGKTVGYTWYGRSYSDRASSKNMYSHSVSKSTDKVTFKVHHAVADPLIGYAPPVNYDYTASIQSNGAFSISGTHDKSPSFSIYISTFPGDTNYNLYFNKSWTGKKFPLGLISQMSFKVTG